MGTGEFQAHPLIMVEHLDVPNVHTLQFLVVARMPLSRHPKEGMEGFYSVSVHDFGTACSVKVLWLSL